MSNNVTVSYQNYIDGKWVDSASKREYPITNPAHKTQVIGNFQLSDIEDTDNAVESASKTSSLWANTPAPSRGQILYKSLEIFSRRFEELARTITEEEGKPINDSRGEIRRAMNIIEYSAGEGRRLFGHTTPSETPNTMAYTTRRPLGVVALITPWNFPMAIPAWKLAPALICGNTIVLKPASGTPLSAVKLVEIFEEAGLPAGVLNLITGSGAAIGNHLVEHPKVNAVSFTGSTEIGTDIYARGARLLKKVQCEMGGKNAVIVLADADMDKALASIVQGAFGSTGQRCTATSRAIVETSVYDQVVDQLALKTSQLKIGDGLDESVDVSPLSSAYQQEKVLEYIGIGTEEGANLVCGGNALSGDLYGDGFYVEPTIFSDVTTDMRIAQEEIFGPVLTAMEAHDIEEAISVSNQVQFGLSSSIYTRDIPKAFQYINTVETGMVHVNAPTLGGEVHLPFGGLKSSGVGQREQGLEGINFFSEVLTAYIDYAEPSV
ncbi:MAG: aldehyde dehydrogenase family protein [Dehalococcoidia bacterium]|nr:aldehyde dehydrogenase family protein [Dehalococcoidia bacterium]